MLFQNLSALLIAANKQKKSIVGGRGLQHFPTLLASSKSVLIKSKKSVGLPLLTSTHCAAVFAARENFERKFIKNLIFAQQVKRMQRRLAER